MGKSIIQQIDEICLEFEDEWQDNKSPVLDEYLQRLPVEYREQLLRDLIPIELCYGNLDDESSESYRKRFPQLSAIIDEAVSRKLPGSSTAIRVEKIGRYDIVRRIGSGGFGIIFEGFDSELNRPVAIKVPKEPWARDDKRIKTAIEEAQLLAGLSHPNIVPVYDAGKCEQFGFYLVTGLVDGMDLSSYSRGTVVDTHETISIISRVADALGHAHSLHIVHRDVKPGNIMIDREGRPVLVDFGLAVDIRDSENGPKHVGTQKYMSPEQERGESHRVDQTTDIYSLGVVLHELLMYPQSLEDTRSFCKTPTERTHRPQFDVNSQIPSDLKRICLRATAVRAADRYQNANELARDLCGTRELLGEPDSKEIFGLEPRGLRSFESSDSRFFLSLLPGPYNAEGLPESVSVLRERVDNNSTMVPSPVAVVFGPSGSGKSSLVKAGLLPLLPRRISAVCVDASLPNLERQLMTGVSATISKSLDCSLPELFAQVRDTDLIPIENKLLIVVDQFESWLSQQSQLEASELVSAMRHCDGRRCQFLLIVRAEFFASTSRLMRFLEIPLSDSVNSFMAVPFDLEHTKRVLTAYGRAYGRIEGNREQETFIAQVATEIFEESDVIPVRLAAFAETLRDAPWTTETLRQFGDVNGVISSYLTNVLENIDSKSVVGENPEATRAVLEALVPAGDNEVQMHTQTFDQLKESCAWKRTSAEFAQLLAQLHGELRLVTAVDDGSSTAHAYRLPHGFLVQPLRHWLQKNKMGTIRGRAELRLKERVRVWENGLRSTFTNKTHLLPSSVEYISYALLTNRSKWNSQTMNMMNESRQTLLPKWRLIATALACLLVVVSIAGYSANRENAKIRHQKNLSELAGVLSAAPASCQERIRQFVDSTTLSERKKLISEIVIDDENATQRLRVKQLLGFDGNIDTDYFVETALYLSEEQHGLRIDEIHTDEFSNILRSLQAANADEVLSAIQRADSITTQNGVKIQRSGHGKRKARLAITAMYLGHPYLAEYICDRNSKEDGGKSRLQDRRAQFLFQSRWLHGDTRLVLDLMKQTDNDGLRSHLASLFGVIGSYQIPADVTAEVEAYLHAALQNRTSAAFAGAAVYTLSRWRKIANKQPVPAIPPSLVEAASDSEFNTIGSIMVKCRSLDPGRVLRIGADELFLWVSRTEVTREQFNQFKEDSAGTDQPLRFANHPAGITQSVSLIEAMEFCNWLSKSEGLETCYDFSRVDSIHDKKIVDIRKVLVNHGNNGYRLPSTHEWNMIAGPQIRPPQVAQVYAWTAENVLSNGLASRPVGQLVPNLNGLTDTYGSVWEWAILPELRWKPSQIETAILFGGSVENTCISLINQVGIIKDSAFVKEFEHVNPVPFPTSIGFRIVRNGT
ncbi:protein kinase [bacterium]|nr:protein kinase [bacterium]